MRQTRLQKLDFPYIVAKETTDGCDPPKQGSKLRRGKLKIQCKTDVKEVLEVMGKETKKTDRGQNYKSTRSGNCRPESLREISSRR